VADAQRATTEGAPDSVVIHEFAHKIDLLHGTPTASRRSAAFDVGLRAEHWSSILSGSQRFVAELELIEWSCQRYRP
jgi:Mlc titration factor MtfA (ptsG expression regulator)